MTDYNQQVPVYPVTKRESTLAIISMVSGIIGWTILPFIGSIVAVITGHLAKKEIRESGNTMSGDGMALAGLILGYTMIGVTLLVLLIILVAVLAFIPIVKSEIGMLPNLLMLI
jgi:hypothetical protein